MKNNVKIKRLILTWLKITFYIKFWIYNQNRICFQIEIKIQNYVEGRSEYS